MARHKIATHDAPESPSAESIADPPPAPPVERPMREDKPSFWDHVAQLDESKWTHHLIYLYRLEPKIDKNGENAFISKYQRPIDQADILTDHGSGRDLAMLNDTRGRKTVNKVTFTVHNAAYPPACRHVAARRHSRERQMAGLARQGQ